MAKNKERGKVKCQYSKKMALTMRVYNRVDDKRMRDEMDRIDAGRNEDKSIAIRVS